MTQYNITIYRTNNKQSTHTIRAKDYDCCIDFLVSQVPENKLDSYDIIESDKYMLYINGLAWHDSYSDNIHEVIAECIALGIYDTACEQAKINIELCKFYCGTPIYYNPNYKHNQ